ncbi:GSCFA domain-containing protein [Labrys neptuniae]|uniref:GSCFA domain-containing protein n=1 Tax=Labrys neptuniae TaxID=376174 RepID=UPI00288FE9CB|nr:GSCFA domain-containing protein [Labrys neptuniae]MDT3376750.1 GSCFA domain-containing protein [Labrys neptuniae]
MKHPYETLPDEAYWRRAVAAPAMTEVDPVAPPQFRIGRSDKVATGGSCFAQHIARHLVQNGFTYLVTETAHPIVPSHLAERFNYGVYTARYGNLYTSRQFLQLLRRAYGFFQAEDMIWHKNDRFIDPYRPQIQPDGFSSREELLADRAQHLAAVRQAVENLDVMVFTLGLTECWIDRASGTVFPLCPGVSGGEFDSTRHVFHNLSSTEVIADMLEAIDFIRYRNAAARFVLTVSPVPLIATASGRPVLQATTYSKSVLRVAAEEIMALRENVEYFPSYEIITGSYNRGAYYGSDLRSVREEGVDHVMRLFLRHFGAVEVSRKPIAPSLGRQDHDSVLADASEMVRVICEEEALGKSAEH